MRKIRAFTLVELLIGISVSGIVIFGFYTVYDFFYQNYLDYKNSRSFFLDTVQLEDEIQNNFFDSDRIISKDKDLNCVSGQRTVQFKFFENYVLRVEGEVIDTFRVKVAELKIDYLNDSLVRNFSYEALYKSERFVFIFRKHYGSIDIINPIKY